MSALPHSWIREENLRPFMFTLGWICGYDFDQNDWVAIEVGLRHSAGAGHCALSYTLQGKTEIAVEITLEAGESVFVLQIATDDCQADQVRLALHLCQSYALR